MSCRDVETTGASGGSFRYAVYFAPPSESEWWDFGCKWLGRDPISGQERAQPRIPAFPAAQMAHLTADPGRYGFHATLKPPFEMVTECSRADFHAAVSALACQQTAFALGRLEATRLGSFIALCPRVVSAQMQELAQACVEELDLFRNSAGAQDMARRRGANLNSRQDALLERWGYPYVLEEWRFHMTLTRSLLHGEDAFLLEWLRPRIERLNASPLSVNALCVFEEPVRGAPFRLTRRFGFDGSVREYAMEGVSLSAPQ